MCSKACKRCGIDKRLDQFSRDARNRDGRYSFCRECVAKARMEYYWKNRDVEQERHAKWLQENAEHSRKWRVANREKMYAAAARYRESNAAKVRARYSERRAHKKTAVPSWASDQEIQNLYELAATLSQSTGIAHEVDHIVPLKSKRVCGLHCESNLQVITRSANRRKSNTHWPDMP